MKTLASALLTLFMLNYPSFISFMIIKQDL